MAKQGWNNKAQQRTADQVHNNLSHLVKVGRMQPVPLTGLQATSDIKTRGAQVSFQVTSLQGVDSFVLLRNFSRDPGSAQQIHVWTAAAVQSTPQTYPVNLQHTDADPAIAGKKAYYWIKAVPVSNQTTSNTFLSGPQQFDASNLPAAAQIAGDFASYQAYTPTTQPLTSTTGGLINAATISVASFQIQYPFDANHDGIPDLITYASGVITPLLDATTYFVYYDDPTYAGGAQTYIATTDQTQVTAGLHRQYVGFITTPVHGGGGTGGSGGGSGACFSGNTKIMTRRGVKPITEIQPGDRVYSRTGWKEVAQLLAHDFDGVMLEMGSGELVTPTHRMRSGSGVWVPASEIFFVTVDFKGQVFNLQLKTQSRNDESCCYLLNNSWFAHNTRKT